MPLFARLRRALARRGVREVTPFDKLRSDARGLAGAAGAADAGRLVAGARAELARFCAVAGRGRPGTTGDAGHPGPDPEPGPP